MAGWPFDVVQWLKATILSFHFGPYTYEAQ